MSIPLTGLKSLLWLIPVFAGCLLATLSVPAASLSIHEPLDYQVYQRMGRSNGVVRVRGEIKPAPMQSASLKFRFISRDQLEVASFSQSLKPGQNSFRAEVTVPAGGWYQLQVLVDDTLLATTQHVGVGEIFIVAGQSNSANHGEAKQKTHSGMAVAFDGRQWQIANDPQPGASGDAGSFIPPLADALVQKFNVPVAFIAIGTGGTSIREWLPGEIHFPNPPTITQNVHKTENGYWRSNGILFNRLEQTIRSAGRFRAVLWHQGESDANQADPTRTLPGHLYSQYLNLIIAQTRKTAGWQIPWFVAQTTYHTPDDTGSEDIRVAQASLWKDGIALRGPDTDQLTGELRENNGQGVHFSDKGLKAHAAAWFTQLEPWLTRQLSASESTEQP